MVKSLTSKYAMEKRKGDTIFKQAIKVENEEAMEQIGNYSISRNQGSQIRREVKTTKKSAMREQDF